ncbi:MAG: ABC transporter permease subunit [Treponema sp.]|nr:ABC transporter permease subunit [Treponema sp.]
MITGVQMILIGKDIRTTTSNRRVMMTLIVMPILLSTLMPLVTIWPFVSKPVEASNEFVRDMLAAEGVAGVAEMSGPELSGAMAGSLFNKMFPLMFLMIPITLSGTMAAGSFIGEREKNTLETLLYSPLPLRDIFAAKILAPFFVGMAATFLSFLWMLAVLGGIAFFTGIRVPLSPNWIPIILLIAPAVSLTAINLVVRLSAKAKTSEEAQSSMMLLILPLMGLMIGQTNGVLRLNLVLFVAVGIGLAIVALFLLKSSFGTFRHEKLLR